MSDTITVKVARTADGLNHGNHIRIPSFGVTKLYIQTSDGKSRSKTCIPDNSTCKKKDSGGSNKFYFAPGIADEKVQIIYNIDDPFGSIQGGKLELFRRFDKTPLWKRDLKKKELEDGEHTLEWGEVGKETKDWDGKLEQNGAITAASDNTKFPEGYFPDGYLTVEHSPYKLKLTLGGEVKGDPHIAWTFFSILVADIELELGDKTVLKDDKDKKIWDIYKKTLTSYPKLHPDSKNAKIYLVSNIFTTSKGGGGGLKEMYDQASYDQYKAKWGDGPIVPIFAKIYIKNSKGKKIEAPLALGRVKFMWDWEDVTEVISRHHKFAKDFLTSTLDYDKTKTEPNGDNCHQERGGKRGPDSAPIFPSQAGYKPAKPLATPPDKLEADKFPFTVEACPTRKWAAFSYAWRKGIVAGKTGVLFQPSRMGGDRYKITVYLAYDKKDDDSIVLDVKDKAHLKCKIKKTSGSFEIWRELHLVKKIKKKNTLPNFDVSKFQDYYEKAYVNMIDKAAYTYMPDWDAKVKAAVAGKAWYIIDAIDNATDHYTIGDYAVHFRTYADYKNAIKASQGWNNAQLTAWLAGGGAVLGNDNKYHEICESWATDILTTAADSYLSADEGINLIQFQGLYNLEDEPGGIGLNGFAANFPSMGRNKCAFVLCPGPDNYTGTNNTKEQTFTHEIGHHLFLPHSPFNVPATDPANWPDPDWHDEAHANCMMTYNYSAERKFCGFCLLRLRGWSRGKIKADGTIDTTSTNLPTNPVLAIDKPDTLVISKTGANNKRT
jgi:hypothetical protein